MALDAKTSAAIDAYTPRTVPTCWPVVGPLVMLSALARLAV
ncbi:hypothetical protein [Streptomyces albofaciens]|nr:hypothetical protein [Streptomyces albofaciens]